MEMREGAYPERAYKGQQPAYMPQAFNRLIVTDLWEIDMDTAQVTMGEQGRMLHHLPPGEGSIGLAEYLGAYSKAHAREVMRLLDHAIENTLPFFYAAVLKSPPRDTIVGMGEPSGNKIAGMFLAPRYPTISFPA